MLISYVRLDHTLYSINYGISTDLFNCEMTTELDQAQYIHNAMS